MKPTRILPFVIALALLSACSEFTRLQKSTDPDEKLQAGKNYFQEKKYVKAATMFEDIMSFYRGTPQAEEVVFLLAESKMGQKDYLSAADYFDSYLRNFPRGSFAEDATFEMAMCNYFESPDARLDQTATNEAIEIFTEFIDVYPYSSRVDSARTLRLELEEKLAYKGYLSAKLYYDLGLYGGNNFRACVLTAENVLRDYPDTRYRDDLVFVILQAKAKEASLSVSERKRERYSEVVDEYYRYANEFPNGKHIREANRLLKEAKSFLN